MRRAEVVIAAWGVVLTVLWTVSWAVFSPDTDTVVMPAAAAAGVFLLAALALLRDRRHPAPSDDLPLAVHETTHATALAGVSIVGLALAFEFGPWLLYVAGGTLLVALGGLVREHRAARAALRRARGEVRR